MICATFARPNGLFIASFWLAARTCFPWDALLPDVHPGLLQPLIMALMMFDNLDDREFSGSLGRLCFILICGALAVVTLSLKKGRGSPLYLNKEGSGDNITNHMLWNMMIGAPLVAILASAVGYLATAQALLARLETSVAIWSLLLVVYHVIRRWMLIQRRRLAFDRAKHRRAEMLAQRARGEEEAHHHSSPEGAVKSMKAKSISMPSVRNPCGWCANFDVDRPAFGHCAVVRNPFRFRLPRKYFAVGCHFHGTGRRKHGADYPRCGADCHSGVYHHHAAGAQPARAAGTGDSAALDLTPGTGYAITTITKYLLMLIGGLVGFSMIGIEWSKLQWLVAALGVGLGFGFAGNFRQLYLWPDYPVRKPIRIGDTVTIRDLTGSVTKINTRATTISDWDQRNYRAEQGVYYRAVYQLVAL